MKILIRLLLALSVMPISGVANASTCCNRHAHNCNKHHCHNCHGHRGNCHSRHSHYRHNNTRTSVGFGISFTTPAYTPTIVEKRYYTPASRVVRTYSAPVVTQTSTQTRTYRSYGSPYGYYESSVTYVEPVPTVSVYETVVEQPIVYEYCGPRTRAEKAADGLRAAGAGLNFVSAMIDAFAD